MLTTWFARLTVITITGALPALSGCVRDVGFNPTGNAVTLSGSWTIAGQEPTIERCERQALAFVRLEFIDQGFTYFFDSLTFPCEQGSFASTDERPIAIDAGDFVVQWTGVDVGETPRQTLPSFAISAVADQPVSLPPAMF